MKLQYRKIEIELSKSDYAIWLEYLNPDRIEPCGRYKSHYILPGRCPFCTRFEIKKPSLHSHGDCSECPLKEWGVHDGNHRIDGCLNIIHDILGNPDRDGVAKTWGLIYCEDCVVIIGAKGRDSLWKMRKAIEQSIVDSDDRPGLQSYLSSKGFEKRDIDTAMNEYKVKEMVGMERAIRDSIDYGRR